MDKIIDINNITPEEYNKRIFEENSAIISNEFRGAILSIKLNNSKIKDFCNILVLGMKAFSKFVSLILCSIIIVNMILTDVSWYWYSIPIILICICFAVNENMYSQIYGFLTKTEYTSNVIDSYDYYCKLFKDPKPIDEFEKDFNMYFK